MADRGNMLSSFVGITGADLDTARFFLEMSGWHLENAMSNFFDQGGVSVPKPVSPPVTTAPQRMETERQEVKVRCEPESFGEHLQLGFSLLFGNDKFSDVVIVANGIQGESQQFRFPAHKLVLCATSQFFRSQLLPSMPPVGEETLNESTPMEEERREGGKHEAQALPTGPVEVVLEMEEQKIPLLKQMLRYMYTGSIQITSDTALPLLQLANRFALHSLKERCGESLFEESKDMVSLVEIAEKYECANLAGKCAAHLAKHFGENVRQGTLLRLSPAMWERLLQSDDIEDDEEDIFWAMMSYAQQQTYEPTDAVLRRLLPGVRLALLPAPFLLEHVERNPVLQTLPFTHPLLHEAYRFKVHRCTKSITPRTVSRKGGLRWSKTLKSSNLTLDTDQLRVTYNTGGTSHQWSSIVAENYFKSGKHSCKMKINKNNSNWIFIGVVGSKWTGYWDNSGYVGMSGDSWAYGCAAGWGKAHNNGHSGYGRPFQTGDVVTMTVNLHQSTLSFSLNGRNFGTAYSNLPSKVRLAVTLYAAGDSVSIMRDERD
jgi:hypothetical protein